MSKPATINATPTWADITPLMLHIIANPRAAADAKEDLRGELLRMAALADLAVAAIDAGLIPPPAPTKPAPRRHVDDPLPPQA